MFLMINDLAFALVTSHFVQHLLLCCSDLHIVVVYLHIFCQYVNMQVIKDSKKIAAEALKQRNK